MTKRLYYTDPLLTAFDATVVSNEIEDGRSVVVLDQTAFYPSSGGQPFDTGQLDGTRVVDVVDREDGTIAHADHPAPAPDVDGRGVVVPAGEGAGLRESITTCAQNFDPHSSPFS